MQTLSYWINNDSTQRAIVTSILSCEMSIPESQHKVYMFKNDYDAMCAEVSKPQHIETGGNLFGLWTTSGSAVIHVVHEPGPFVNDSHMLCRVGEWHSHHRLSLDQPSAGEEQAVRRNFPQDMSKFLVIIGNIKNGDSVLFPYFFTDGGTRYEKAEFVVLESKNPFSNDAKMLAKIERGAEGNQGRASLTAFETPQNTGSNSHQNRNTSPTYSQVVSRSSHENSRQTGSITQRDGNTSSTHLQATPPAPHVSAQTSDNPPENSTIQNQTATTEDEKATTKEIIMKDTYDELEKFFGQGNVEIERTSHGDINMIFEHESYHWMVRFPENFPNQPAKLYRESNRHSSSSSLCPHYYLEKPLTNHVNILLSITKNCWLSCKICENISKENLTPEVGPTIPVDHAAQTTDNPPENGSAQNKTAKEITMKDIHDELEKLFGQGKVEIARSYDDINMIFEHESYHWMVRFPKNFPNQPAQLYREWKHHFPSSSSGPLYNLEKPLTNRVNVLLSIKKNCRSSCKICKKISKEKLTKPAAAVPPVTTTFADVVKELANEIKMTDMARPLSFSDRTLNDGSHKIEFEHYYKKWSIKIPAEFPEKPAEVYKQERPYGAPEKKTINDSSKSGYEQKSLVSSDLIMLAIRSNCYCSPCWNNSSCKQLRN